MTQEQRIRIGEILIAMSQLYGGQEIQRPALKMILNAIDDLPFDAVSAGLDRWVKDPKSTRLPMPGQIRLFCGAIEPDDDTIARDTASKAVGAVSKFGYPNGREARAYIGELGWKAIERRGGWSAFCNLETRNESIVTAQMRDEIKALIVLSRAGRLDQPAMLPESNKPSDEVRQLASSIVKELK